MQKCKGQSYMYLLAHWPIGESWLATPPLYSVLAPLCFVTSQGHRVPTKVAKHTVECLPYQFVRLHCGNPVKAGRQFLFHISNFLQAKALIFCSLVHKLAM